MSCYLLVPIQEKMSEFEGETSPVKKKKRQERALRRSSRDSPPRRQSRSHSTKKNLSKRPPEIERKAARKTSKSQKRRSSRGSKKQKREQCCPLCCPTGPCSKSKNTKKECEVKCGQELMKCCKIMEAVINTRKMPRKPALLALRKPIQDLFRSVLKRSVFSEKGLQKIEPFFTEQVKESVHFSQDDFSTKYNSLLMKQSDILFAICLFLKRRVKKTKGDHISNQFTSAVIYCQNRFNSQ